MSGELGSNATTARKLWLEDIDEKEEARIYQLAYSLIFLLPWMRRLLRRGPLSTAIPRVSAGGLKPEIVAPARTPAPVAAAP